MAVTRRSKCSRSHVGGKPRSLIAELQYAANSSARMSARDRFLSLVNFGLGGLRSFERSLFKEHTAHRHRSALEGAGISGRGWKDLAILHNSVWFARRYGLCRSVHQ